MFSVNNNGLLTVRHLLIIKDTARANKRIFFRIFVNVLLKTDKANVSFSQNAFNVKRHANHTSHKRKQVFPAVS